MKIFTQDIINEKNVPYCSLIANQTNDFRSVDRPKSKHLISEGVSNYSLCVIPSAYIIKHYLQNNESENLLHLKQKICNIDTTFNEIDIKIQSCKDKIQSIKNNKLDKQDDTHVSKSISNKWSKSKVSFQSDVHFIETTNKVCNIYNNCKNDSSNARNYSSINKIYDRSICKNVIQLNAFKYKELYVQDKSIATNNNQHSSNIPSKFGKLNRSSIKPIKNQTTNIKRYQCSNILSWTLHTKSSTLNTIDRTNR